MRGWAPSAKVPSLRVVVVGISGSSEPPISSCVGAGAGAGEVLMPVPPGLPGPPVDAAGASATLVVSSPSRGGGDVGSCIAESDVVATLEPAAASTAIVAGVAAMRTVTPSAVGGTGFPPPPQPAPVVTAVSVVAIVAVSGLVFPRLVAVVVATTEEEFNHCIGVEMSSSWSWEFFRTTAVAAAVVWVSGPGVEGFKAGARDFETW